MGTAGPRQGAPALTGTLGSLVRCDVWHEAVRDRHDALFNYAFCVNGKDPGPWEMPPIPEGVEP